MAVIYRTYAHKRGPSNSMNVEVLVDDSSFDLFWQKKQFQRALWRDADYACLFADDTRIFEWIDGSVILNRLDEYDKPEAHGLTIDGQFYTFDELSDSVIDGLEPDHPDSPLMKAGLI